MNDLKDVIAAARSKGCMGVCVIDQGGGNFVAICMGSDGRVRDPRSAHTHATPEAAIDDLAERLR
jgi:1,4-dihydroxy-2-naphthoyl-CoA synthase